MKLEIFEWLRQNKDKFDLHTPCLLQNQLSVFIYLFDSLQKIKVKDFKKQLES